MNSLVLWEAGGYIHSALSNLKAGSIRRQTVRMLLGVSGVAAAIACLTLAGGLDALANDGRVDVRQTLAYLAIYWGLACLLVLVFAGFRCKPKQAALSLLSVVLGLILAEVMLQVAYPPCWRRFVHATSPVYHHLGRPNQENVYFGTIDGEHVFVTTNEDGLRTRYSRQGFRLHKHRIVAMGDSFTFGFRVRQEKAFPQVMEKLLRETLSRGDISVLNAGVISHSPLLARRLFDAVIHHYGPHLVLYFLDATDIGDDYHYAQSLMKGSEQTFDLRGVSVPGYYGAVAHLTHVEGLIDHGLEHAQHILSLLSQDPAVRPREYDWYDFRLRIGGVVETNRFFIFRHPLEQTRPYFEATFGHVRALADAVRKQGAGFVLVVLPRFQHWNPRECRDNLEAREYALAEPFQDEYLRFFESKRSRVSFEILNLLPVFRSARAPAERSFVFKDDPHWNDAGHALVAETIANHLLKTKRFD